MYLNLPTEPTMLHFSVMSVLTFGILCCVQGHRSYESQPCFVRSLYVSCPAGGCQPTLQHVGHLRHGGAVEVKGPSENHCGAVGHLNVVLWVIIMDIHSDILLMGNEHYICFA